LKPLPGKQTFVRLIPPVHSVHTFNAGKAFKEDGKGPKQGAAEEQYMAHNWEMYTARLICVFEIDVIGKNYVRQTCKLAYIHYLDACANNGKSTIDKLQNTDRVRGQNPDQRQLYEVVEYERILGPEFIIPCFEEDSTMKAYNERISRGNTDLCRKPLTQKEVWCRMKFVRWIGSAHATPVEDSIE
jgi:hypothetical protein